MTLFQMDKKFSGILCLCDSLNYLDGFDQMTRTFQKAFEHLEDHGLFIFDINSIFKYRHMADKVFTEEVDDLFYVWKNFYLEEEKQNIYQVHFFEKMGAYYRRFDEEHVQYGYEKDELDEILQQIGFTTTWYDGYGFEPVREDSERLVCIAEKGK